MDTTGHFYSTNGIEIHTQEAGPAHGQTLLFLHGFPEFWYGWQKQLAFFAQKGWHVVAPDQRGYNLSTKPKGKEAYTIDQLTQDILGLLPQVSTGKVVLVGHDWGGAVAWHLAQQYPDVIEKLIILNMPHPTVLQEHLTGNPKQMVKSWYTGAFQLPWVPEKVTGAFDFKLLETALTSSAKPGTFGPEDLALYKEAWSQPGALEGMINWYRAYHYQPAQPPSKIAVPTLLLWGKRDQFLGAELAQPSIEQCSNGTLHFLETASHWLHHEEPEKVNQLILDFVLEKPIS